MYATGMHRTLELRPLPGEEKGKKKEKKRRKRKQKKKKNQKHTLTSTPLINNSKILSLETLEAAPLGIGHASTISLVHKFKN